MENGTTATTEMAASRTNGVSSGENSVQNAPPDNSPASAHTAENSIAETDALITLVRRAPALAALGDGPLDRRDLEDRLGVSKPTVHRLTRRLGEMGLVERSNGRFVLTGVGRVVAETVTAFTQSVETAHRLAPLLESHDDPSLDIAAFADATVTTAGPGDPYRPMRRYYSFIERTETLCEFDTTLLSPEYVDALTRRIHDGMETELVYPPAVATQLLSAHPERMAELAESGYLDLRVHPNLPYGLAIFDERVAVASYCETTGALRTFIDTNSPAAREWAEGVYATYRAEAAELPISELRGETTAPLRL